MSEEKAYLVFKKHFRDLRLLSDVGQRLYKAQRKEVHGRFYAVYEELGCIINELEKHQKTLVKGLLSIAFTELIINLHVL